MLSLQECHKIANITIKKYAKKPKIFFNNIDNYDKVVRNILSADEKFKTDKGCTLSSYRISRARWAIKDVEYLFIKRRNKQQTYQLIYDIPSVKYEPSQKLIKEELLEQIMTLINDNNILTDLERKYLLARFLNRNNLKDIANANQCSINNVYLKINNALLKLKQQYNITYNNREIFNGHN